MILEFCFGSSIKGKAADPFWHFRFLIVKFFFSPHFWFFSCGGGEGGFHLLKRSEVRDPQNKKVVFISHRCFV